MPPRDPFAWLPAEIRAAVLGCLKSGDLYSSIQASPALLLAFTEFRREILSRAVRHVIHPQVMNDALGVIYCPRFETGCEAVAPNIASQPFLTCKFPETAASMCRRGMAFLMARF